MRKGSDGTHCSRAGRKSLGNPGGHGCVPLMRFAYDGGDRSVESRIAPLDVEGGGTARCGGCSRRNREALPIRRSLAAGNRSWRLRHAPGWYVLPRSDSSSFLVALIPSGSLSRLALVLDAHEAVVAGVGDDLHDPGEVEHGLPAGVVEVVALGRDPLGIRHHPGDRVVDVDRVLAASAFAGKLPKSGSVPKVGLFTAFIRAIRASGLLEGPPWFSQMILIRLFSPYSASLDAAPRPRRRRRSGCSCARC